LGKVCNLFRSYPICGVLINNHDQAFTSQVSFIPRVMIISKDDLGCVIERQPHLSIARSRRVWQIDVTPTSHVRRQVRQVSPLNAEIGTKTRMVEMTATAYLDERGSPALSLEPTFPPEPLCPNDTSTHSHAAVGTFSDCACKLHIGGTYFITLSQELC
jgi:hypothetical protein